MKLICSRVNTERFKVHGNNYWTGWNGITHGGTHNQIRRGTSSKTQKTWSDDVRARRQGYRVLSCIFLLERASLAIENFFQQVLLQGRSLPRHQVQKSVKLKWVGMDPPVKLEKIVAMDCIVELIDWHIPCSVHSPCIHCSEQVDQVRSLAIYYRACIHILMLKSYFIQVQTFTWEWLLISTTGSTAMDSVWSHLNFFSLIWTIIIYI